MKTNPAKPPGYDFKPSFYFEQARPEMQQFVPANCKRILDVGCGQGKFGELLKQSRSIEVWGIEPVAAAAAEAATKLDHVIEGMFIPEADLPSENFDAIFFNDVLEHLFDPAAALQLARKLLKPDGVVIASIPNIRHFLTMWELIVRREWHYGDSGILDRTHLRFFTKKSIIALFADCGFNVERIEGINSHWGGTPRKWLSYKIINGLTFNAIEDMKHLQFAVVAKPAV
jgi:2-polyprenyl-3-methyl-5-hydroxy-6-metoxy-1,4-benzoquinol methylase